MKKVLVLLITMAMFLCSHSAFASSYEDYDFMNEENCLIAEYCGKVLSMMTDGELTKDTYAFLNIYTDYPYITPETVWITNTENVVTPATE